MSTLVTATVKSNSSSPPAFQNSSGTEIGTLCRAWVNFNASSGSPSIRAQFNVSSITDNGVGNYTVNFTNALADANYVVTFGVGGGGSSLNASFVGGVLTSTQYGVASNKTASAVQFTTGDYTATLRDLGEIYVSLFR